MEIITVAKAIVLSTDNQILILKRSSTHPTMAGYLDLPGGIINPGEEPGQALIREILEETKLVVDFSDLHLVYSGTGTYEDKVSYVRFLYVVRLKTPKPTIELSFEHDEFYWQPLDKLASIENEYIPFYAEAFDYLIKNHILETLGNS